MPAETFYVWAVLLQVAACAIAGVGLRYLIKYAADTARIASAAIEQSEVPQKPCIAVLQPPDTSDDALLEGMTSSVLGEVTVRFRNIGLGPAVNIRFRFRTLTARAGPLEMEQAPLSAPLAAGEGGDTNHPVTALSPKEEIVFDYESLSGARYRSRAVISGRRWVHDFRFSRLRGDEPDPPSVPSA